LYLQFPYASNEFIKLRHENKVAKLAEGLNNSIGYHSAKDQELHANQPELTKLYLAAIAENRKSGQQTCIKSSSRRDTLPGVNSSE